MRLLICDDHQLFLDALSMALTDHGCTVVATALDPDQAVTSARELRPDVCLLDMSFPSGSGLSAISRIHEVSPETKVVVLSGSTSRTLVKEAIGQGAEGFVGKQQPVSVIVQAVELAHQGRLAVDPLVMRRLFEPGGDQVDPLHGLRFLTEREWDVLRFIMEGLTTEQMADRLGVRPSTAHTHVQNLFVKLGVHSRLQAAALMTAHASVDTWPAHLH